MCLVRMVLHMKALVEGMGMGYRKGLRGILLSGRVSSKVGTVIHRPFHRSDTRGMGNCRFHRTNNRKTRDVWFHTAYQVFAYRHFVPQFFFSSSFSSICVFQCTYFLNIITERNN